MTPTYKLRYTSPDPEQTKAQVLAYAERRARINRKNARRSTGPRTVEGKQRSSQNAITHGLTAKTAFLPGEDFAAYQAHHQDAVDCYQPATFTERALVRQIADTDWMLKRLPLLEHKALAGANGVYPRETLDSLSRIGSRLKRDFLKAVQKLENLQYVRRANEREQLENAVGIMELHKYKGLPYDPAEDGFVFSLDYLQRQSETMMRHNIARGVSHSLFQSHRALAEWPRKADWGEKSAAHS